MFTKTLSYARAGDVSKLLKDARVLSNRGSALVDDRTNTIIINDLPEAIAECESLIGILDVYSFPGSEIAVVVYAGDVVGGRLEARDECLEARTFPPEHIPWDDLAFDSTKAALKDYVRRFFPRVRVPR